MTRDTTSDGKPYARRDNEVARPPLLQLDINSIMNASTENGKSKISCHRASKQK